jgi:recombination associated protein RdgC
MGMLEQITRSAFLGEEFLTWLWYLSETEREPMAIPKIGGCQVAIGQEIILGDESGDAQTVVLRGDMPSASAEAREALASGKRLRRAKLYLTIEGVQWGCTIVGTTLAISGLRVPAAAGADFETHCLSRLEAMERAGRAIHWLFEQFLERRLDAKRWEADLRVIGKWATEKR